MGAAKTLLENSQKLYGMLGDRKAPAAGGVALKAMLGKDLEIAKSFGAAGFADLFGHRELSDNSPVGSCLNFGSKSSVGGMPEETRLRLFNLKKLVSNVEIQAQYLYKTPHPTPDQMKSVPLFKQLEPMLKAFDVTDFSTFIQTVNVRFYFEEYEIPLMVGDLFDQLPMASASENVTGILSRLFGKLETDAATYGVQSNTQSNYLIAAKDNVVHTEITQDLNQDSAPAVIDKIRKEVNLGIARSEERAYLDGDTTGTHMDADVTAGTDFRKAYKGIRKLGLANSANGSVYDHAGDLPSKILFDNLLLKMGKFGSEKADLCWIMGSFVENRLVTGAIPELFTAFAFGGQASNVTGQVPPVYGIKGVTSEWVREDLAATGVYTVGGETKTWMALVKKSRILRHLRAPVRVWAAPSLPSSDKMLMTAKKRHTFSAYPQSATEKSIIVGINIETAL
jgi:hypothetical protein